MCKYLKGCNLAISLFLFNDVQCGDKREWQKLKRRKVCLNNRKHLFDVLVMAHQYSLPREIGQIGGHVPGHPALVVPALKMS